MWFLKYFMAVSSTYAYIPYLNIELNSWQGILVFEEGNNFSFHSVIFSDIHSQFCRDFENNGN